jgi:starch phosphorylase
MRRSGLTFWEALWATRPGNLFTTHTPVVSGFDRFPPDLLVKYARYFEAFLADTGIEASELLARGRSLPDDGEPFNMAYLAMRGSLAVVSKKVVHLIRHRPLRERA